MSECVPRIDAREATAIARAEKMLAVAPFIAIDLDEMNDVRIRLAQHEAMFDAAMSPSKRKEIERLMADDIAELADAYKRMARAVERRGEA